MVEKEYHEMVLETVYPSGEEEWYCPTCGRRFLVRWPPEYSKVILETGDKNAIHSGGKTEEREETTQGMDMAGMAVRDTDLQQTNAGDTFASNDQDQWLRPYVEWLEKIGFESLWKEG